MGSDARGLYGVFSCDNSVRWRFPLTSEQGGVAPCIMMLGARNEVPEYLYSFRGMQGDDRVGVLKWATSAEWVFY